MPETNEVQLPNAEEAVNLMEGLYQEAFFGKLAEVGIYPQTEKEALSMLSTAVKLDGIPEAPEQKQASFFENVEQSLDSVLSEHGINQQPQQGFDSKQAAFAIAQDPDFYKAALAIAVAGQAEEQPAE